MSSDGIPGGLKYTIQDEDDIQIWEIPEREAEVFSALKTLTNFVKTRTS